jgi:hypothetical protein
MADANSVQNAIDGVDVNSKSLPWRVVNLLRNGVVGDLSKVTDGTAEGPNTSTSVFDQVATLAKILTRRYVTKSADTLDIWDMVVRLYQDAFEED